MGASLYVKDKARRLLNTGKVTRVGRNRFKVRDAGRNYWVTVHSFGPQCSCRSYARCSHEVAVQGFIGRELAAAMEEADRNEEIGL